jgi:hypothetical protein
MSDHDHNPQIFMQTEGPPLPPEVEEVMSQLRFVDLRVLIAFAAGCGWRYDVNNGLQLTAPDGTHMSLPLHSGLNAKVFRSRLNTIIRHRTPKAPLRSMVESLIAHPKVKLDPDRVAVLREAVEKAPAIKVQEPTAPEEPTKAQVKVTRRKLRIVREEPWSAHRNAKGETYPSEAVMERHWSNDTVDYACRWEGCEYTDDSPHSVASHNASHKRGMGTQPQPAVDGLDPEWAANPRRTTRIRNLAREIDGALKAAMAAGVTPDPEWLAQWIIDHRIESLPSDSPISEPLTPEQILDKIAALVDRGRGQVLREQVDTLQSQVEGFMSEVAAAQALADAQALRAQRAEGNLQALGEMLSELQNRKDES